MIRLGLDDASKIALVSEYVQREQIVKVVTFSPPRFRLALDLVCQWEQVDWEEIIMYRTFYRLLHEIDSRTLVVINECLRTPTRSALTYNCLRNYLTRTEHQIVFSRFPALESPGDFMILADLDTRSRWRRCGIDEVGETLDVGFVDVAPIVKPIEIETDAKTRTQYAKKKRSLIDGIGSKDPHTIPRKLHLLAGKHKARVAGERGGLWVGRNARLKVANFATYSDATEPRQVLEFCHSYREWSDYLTASGAIEVPALASDLNVDRWYLDHFQKWTEMQHYAYAAIRDHLGS